MSLRNSYVSAALVAAVVVTAAAPAAARSTASFLSIDRKQVEYGQTQVALSGTIPSKRAGETVYILSQACLFTEPAEIATVKTKAGGAYVFRLEPMLNTTFRVRVGSARSAAVKVAVRPRVAVRKLRAGVYRVEVSTTNPVFLAGSPVHLQRQVGGRWATAKSAKLVKASPETAITVVSAATIRASVSGQVRAVVPATRCYLAGTSAPISG
jgi:hypothetical protein